MSQEDQMLAMLREAGSKGVHTFEARRAFIGNPSERVRKLKEQGYHIETGPRERLQGKALGVRYKLVGPPAGMGSEPSPGVPASLSGLNERAPGDARLFAPASAIYGDEAA